MTVSRGDPSGPQPAPLVRVKDTAGEDGTAGVESLAGELESEFVESAEGGRIGSVGHVEVFWMGGALNTAFARYAAVNSASTIGLASHR